MTVVTIEDLEVCNLPLREAEALGYTALGLSAKEIAREMNISQRSVEKKLEVAILRFGARNRCHLIVRAFEVGALAIRRQPIAVLAFALTIFGALPLPDHTPDEFRRSPTRTLRRREDGMHVRFDLVEDYGV